MEKINFNFLTLFAKFQSMILMTLRELYFFYIYKINMNLIIVELFNQKIYSVIYIHDL